MNDADQPKPTPVKPKRTYKAGRKPILIAELVAADLVELKGNLSAIARKYNVSRASVCDLVAKRPNLQKIMEDARESRLDAAEDKLGQKIDDGEGWAVCFFLKTQGKKRGYVERQELTGAEGGPVQVEQVTLDERRRRVEELIAQARRQCVQAGVESRG